MHQASIYRGDHRFEIVGKETPKPAPGEVKIRVAYCGICGTDIHVYHGNMDARVGFERTIGHEMSGVIDEIGAEVEGLKAGDRVVVRPLDPCGDCPACAADLRHICHNLNFLGLDSHGAMQEFWNVPAYCVHKLPKHVSLELAALVEPLAVACHNVRMAELHDGDDVVVIGGGPIGMLVALVARHMGGNVTISEVNPFRLELARKLGFDVINPAKVDIQAAIDEKTAHKRADIVFEVSGTKAGVDTMTDIIACRGKIVMVAIHAKPPEVNLFQFFWRELKMIGARVYVEADYEQAIALIADGELDPAPLITDRTPLVNTQGAFENLDKAANAMKSLIEIGGEDA